MDPTRFIDYYELLQVSPNADADTIQRVFRHLAKKYHPDHHEAPDEETAFRVSLLSRENGALSAETGFVSLTWARAEGEGKLRIVWREGGGPPVTAPAQRGFGSLLLERTLARDLDGRVELTFDPAGVVCTIDMPISEQGGHPCLG